VFSSRFTPAAALRAAPLLGFATGPVVTTVMAGRRVRPGRILRLVHYSVSHRQCVATVARDKAVKNGCRLESHLMRNPPRIRIVQKREVTRNAARVENSAAQCATRTCVVSVFDVCLRKTCRPWRLVLPASSNLVFSSQPPH